MVQAMNKSDKKGQNRISSLLYAVKSYFSVQANVLIVLLPSSFLC